MPATKEAIRKGWALRQAREEEKRVQLSAELRARGVPPEWCVNSHDRTVVGVNGKRECRQCARDRAQLRRDQEGRKPAPDGWEDEFGPVPARRGNHIWVDRVILERWLSDQELGRLRTIGEARALHLLSIMRGQTGA